MTNQDRHRVVEALRRSRPKRRFVRRSGYGLVGLAIWSWIAGGFISSQIDWERRLAGLARFAGELVPYPLRERGAGLDVLWSWGFGLWVDRGSVAALSTLSISIVAIVAAAGVGAVLTLPAVRTLATAEPYLPAVGAVTVAAPRLWQVMVATARLLLAFLRAIPEYIWAFLLIGVLGPTPWPAILALMLHNAGILGRLNAEVIEDLEPAPLVSLRAAGGCRLGIAGWGIAPMALPRLLLFFFYRWESCVREATVLGLLGIVSIGFWIQDARARQQPDTMLFFVLLGALLVMLCDFLSGVARRWVRRAR